MPEAPTLDAPRLASIPAPAPGPLHRRPYVPAFDGLRALLVGAVLAYHLSGARLASATGEVAVICFFSLSGFLITFLLADEHRRSGTIRVAAFLRRRAVRLVPALALLLGVWTVVALVFRDAAWVTSVPGGGPGGPIAPATVAETVGAALAYLTNWIDAFVQLDLWSGYSPLGHLWSLAVEEQFYLVWAPLMVFLLRRRRPGLWIALLAVAFLCEPVLLYHQGTNRVYFGTDTRMSALLLGAVAGWWWRTGRLVVLERLALTPVVGALSAVGLVVAGIGFRRPDVGWEWIGGMLLASVSGASLVTYLATRGEETGVAGLLGHRALVWLGRRSYAVYLWSYVLNTWFRSLGPAGGVLVVVCTIGMADLSYRLVEQPLRRRGSQPAPVPLDVATGVARRSRPPVPAPVPTATLGPAVASELVLAEG